MDKRESVISNQLRNILEAQPVEASAPCRIDMGGTLDIPTFFYPLRRLNPCTFNIALGLRTQVRLEPYTNGLIKISSRGFEDAEFSVDAAPFDHPLGLICATATYFNAGGVHIKIESESPPRSALGGSSSATVALVAAFLRLSKQHLHADDVLNRREITLLAYRLEQTVAGVPCGIQDQLAAAYGGVNAWYLQANPEKSEYSKKVAVKTSFHKKFEQHLLLAYCGIPHESKDINSQWVKQFLAGNYRRHWAEIIDCTRSFVEAISRKDFKLAAACMNRETKLRTEMTPEVLNEVGEALVSLAIRAQCGARFTGAGGGGCIWALGDIENIDRLKKVWEETLSTIDNGCLLDVNIDSRGVVVH